MECAFDEEKAKDIINSFASKHGQTESLPAGGHYVTDEFENINLSVESEESKSYTIFRLIADDEDDDEDATEVVLYTVGVLAQKLFPPFKPRRQYNHNRQSVFAGFKQSVTLLGVKSNIMDKAVDFVQAAYVELQRHVPKAAPFPSDRVNDDNFVLSNPYFTVGDDAKDKVKVVFPKTVDPFDDLGRAQSDECVHTADNEVQYLQGYDDERGVYRQVTISPTQFQPGDIVRVGFSVCFKKDNKIHASADLALVLRSVTLVDKTISTAIAKRELKQPSPPAGRKRGAITRAKLVEDSEERPIAKVRKALAKMAIGTGAMDVETEDVVDADGASQPA